MPSMHSLISAGGEEQPHRVHSKAGPVICCPPSPNPQLPEPHLPTLRALSAAAIVKPKDSPSHFLSFRAPAALFPLPPPPPRPHPRVSPQAARSQGAREPHISPPGTPPHPLRLFPCVPAACTSPCRVPASVGTTTLRIRTALVFRTAFPFFLGPARDQAAPNAPPRATCDIGPIAIVEHLELGRVTWRTTAASRTGSMRGLSSMGSHRARGILPLQISSEPIPHWLAARKQ